MFAENIKTNGLVTIELIGPDGEVKKVQKNNLILATGLAFITSRIKENTTTPVSHMALGTGTAAALIGNDALGSESARVALDSSGIVTTTVANDSIQYIATFSAGTATGAITEAGLFNTGVGAGILARVVFPVINKGTLDTLVITWKIIIS